MYLYSEEYVKLNGIEHYFLHYPNKSDVVILFLHGGPGQTESFWAYKTKDERLKCNIVYYDQRGAGKTQLKSPSTMEDVNLENLLQDLQEVIQYVKRKYLTNKIILLGHSWGSVLGTCYIKKYPHDVLCYVGMGQVVDFMLGEKLNYDKLGQSLESSNDKRNIKKYQQFKGYPYNLTKENLLSSILDFRKLQGKYGLTGDVWNQTKIMLKSPIVGVKDFINLINYKKDMNTSKNLIEYLLTYSIINDKDYRLPIYYICGRNDWQVPSTLVNDYFETINAPKKKLYWVENAGHLTDIDNPYGFNNALLDIINSL
ncbi:alpha/beta fold hydrolase [Clostridium sp. AL.422]|uniref:alpha/beta fold hydrolase n=1 Tax=Clostridium TaxID=1485 RepID=UPI00293DC8FB|nr:MULTISPECIES: alpha/beta fold hydrolase [unclassified Clostridium]MDV4149788.1 alpha/beta fold hydrolase [Clostridium sp. AL.422]